MKLNTLPDILYIRSTLPELVDKYFPFPTYHKGQREAIIGIINGFLDGNRHMIVQAPTGIGKSVIATTVHKVLSHIVVGYRTTITTSTKGLQDQYLADESYMDDLRGKSNYGCIVGVSPMGSSECKMAVGKRQCQPAKQCEYLRARNTWMRSRFRITNSVMQIILPLFICGDAYKADLMVVDECHKIDSSLVDNATLTIDTKSFEIASHFGDTGNNLIARIGKLMFMSRTMVQGDVIENLRDREDIMEVIEEIGVAAADLLNVLTANNDISPEACILLPQLQELVETTTIPLNADPCTFIINELSDSKIVFKPVYASAVADYGLFRKADRFLHMSATICGLDAYARSLGIKQGEYGTIDVENPIPMSNRPVLYIPRERMTGFIDDTKVRSIVDDIDSIIEHHGNENGIIHSVSYKLANAIMDASRFRRRMYVPRGREEILNILSRHNSGAIVISPAMEEGYDFKGDMSRWQIIPKTPFGYLGDPLIKLNSARNPDYYMRNTVVRIVQMAGRSVRGVEDSAVTYILDEAFGGVVAGRGAAFIPKWFADSITAHTD